jgi:hypothetical protein
MDQYARSTWGFSFFEGKLFVPRTPLKAVAVVSAPVGSDLRYARSTWGFSFFEGKLFVPCTPPKDVAVVSAPVGSDLRYARSTWGFSLFEGKLFVPRTPPKAVAVVYAPVGSDLVEWHGHFVPPDCDLERLYLARENAHIRDAHIVFRDSDHCYFIRGVPWLNMSVTSVIHKAFHAFDSYAIAAAMIGKPAFRSAAAKYAKYQHLRWDANGNEVSDPDLIRIINQTWLDYGAEMADLGTRLHRDIELFYNGTRVVNETIEFSHFVAYKDMKQQEGWQPYRTEMMVYGEQEGICGSVDMIYIDPNGHYHMADWKRSKLISKFGFGKTGKGMLAHLPDANYFHYSLQLNLYAYLLAKYYDIVCRDLTIVVFHPSNKTFLEFNVRPMAMEVAALIDMSTTS